MISSLRGKIKNIGLDNLEIDVGGVGYEVNYRNRDNLWNVGDEVDMVCQMIVGENEMSLYGFKDKEEKVLFNMLDSVSGIGPKIAAKIIGELGGEEIKRAVFEADLKSITRVKGVGTKAGQKIIIELKNKIGGENLDLKDGNEKEGDDLEVSLRQLGFSTEEIKKMKKDMPKFENIEEKIGWCLRNK